MRSLRVGWDDSLAGTDRAGTGIYAARLLEQFSNKKDLQMEVLRGWRRNNSTGLASRGWKSLSQLFWNHAYLPRIIEKMGVDLLHAPAFIAPHSLSCPLIVTVHDISYLLFPSHFSRWWGTYMRAIMPGIMSSAACILCGSEHSKKDIIGTYGIPSNRVRVTPYGVDHDRFHPGVELDRVWAKSIGIGEGYLLHVGTFSYRKNIPTLLRAIAHLRTMGKLGKRQLVLAGSQARGLKGGAEIIETIEHLALADNVVLAGHVPDEHVAGLYAGASILVMPSLYEGFGFPVLESMAVGTPVVASNSSSLPEVGGDAATLFAPLDHLELSAAIDDILTSGSLARELRRKGLRRAMEFNWARTADETAQIYRSVAGG